MRGFSFAPIGFAATVLIVLFTADSISAAPLTIVDVDLGTIAVETNVNASVYNSADPSMAQTYTYNQLLQNPGNVTDGITLDNGNTIDQELTAQGYFQNTGVFNYNFPLTSGGASGAYSQAGSPVYPPAPFPGTVSLTSSSVSGTICTGFNSVGSTITVDPIDAASTYSIILGCDSSTSINDGFPGSTTSTVSLNLGTVTDLNAGTITYITGEVPTTTWESSGMINTVAGPVSGVPEPSPGWFVMLGIAGIVAIRRVRLLH